MLEAKNPSPVFFGKKLALILGAALLLGYAVITGFAVHEKSHRASIEKREDYGVGDKVLFPRTFDTAAPLVLYGGHSLYFVDYKVISDTFMVKVGMDDSNEFTIYKMTGAQGKEAEFLCLKIAPFYYARATQK